MLNKANTETWSAARPVSRSGEPILFALLLLDFLLFAGGAFAHLGIPIPLGFATWNETFLIPAAIVEGIGALALGVALLNLVAGPAWARRWCWLALGYSFAGVLWGMARL